MKKQFYVAIPAYNEEGSIGYCLKTLRWAVKVASTKKYSILKTYICVNGCTDDTEREIWKLSRTYPDLKIKILHSKKGMNKAMNRIVQCIPSKNAPIVKIDADAEMSRSSLTILLDELSRHPELKVAGGYPVAHRYTSNNLYKKLISRILDVRSAHPMSQISVHNVKDFHPLSYNDPQTTVTPEFEESSRIFFHGRYYALRSKELWNVPWDRIGDDTYLTLSLYKKFGKGAIRIRYDAMCYYQPSTSLIFHWKVYKRIFCDTYTLFDLPEFQGMDEIRKREDVKLNWNYICTLPFGVQSCFVVYLIIKHINSYLFRISPKYDDRLWTYKRKPRP